MIATLLLSVALVASAVALLAVRSIVKKDGQLRSMHIHDSAALQQKGIHCALTQDEEERKKAKSKGENKQITIV